jgi:hypothetical protein
MLHDIVFLEPLWDALSFAPVLLSIIGGGLLALGLFGARGWEPSCRRCRHDLRAVTLDAPDARCPECGLELSIRDGVRAGRRRTRWGRVATGTFCIALGVAPSFGATPASLRAAIASTLTPEEIYAEHLTGTRLASTIHMQRVTDEAYASSILNEVARLYAGPPSGWPNERPLMDALDILRQQASAGLRPADAASAPDAFENRLARRFAEAAAEENGAHAARIAQLAQRLATGGSELTRRLLLASESLVPLWIRVHVPNTAIVGEDMTISASFNPGWFSGRIRPEPLVRAVRSRTSPDAPWVDVPLKTEFQGLSMTHAGPGSIELEITVDLSMPLEPGQSPADRMVVTSRLLHRIDIVTQDSFVIEPMRGEATRALIEPTLRELRLERRGAMISLKMPMGGHAGQQGGDDIRYGGLMTVRAGQQDNLLEGQLGTFYYDLRGSGGGGFSGGKRIDPSALENAGRITLRIEPSLDGLRQTIREDVRYVNEIIELDFDGFGVPPTAIRWFDRAAAE